MESQRQKKYSRLLQKEMGKIFQEDKRGIVGNAFITVVDVKVSPDLSVAKFYLSMMLIPNKDELYKRINDRKSEIRNALGQAIGKQVRKVPEIIFYIDEVEESAHRIEDILSNLDIPPSDSEQE